MDEAAMTITVPAGARDYTAPGEVLKVAARCQAASDAATETQLRAQRLLANSHVLVRRARLLRTKSQELRVGRGQSAELRMSRSA